MVTEQIISIDFKDGQFVKKGQLLAQLDPSSLQAQLAQAEANLPRDQAHLQNAQLNLSRYVPLEKKGLARARKLPTTKPTTANQGAPEKGARRRTHSARPSQGYTKRWRQLEGAA